MGSGDSSGGGDDSGSGDQTADQSGDNTNDDASKVAGTGIFDSIKSLFSGMNGLQSGLGAPPPWIGMGGTNLGIVKPKTPAPPQFVTAKAPAPVSKGVSTGVVVGGLALVAVAAGLFIWSMSSKKKGTKK